MKKVALSNAGRNYLIKQMNAEAGLAGALAMALTDDVYAYLPGPTPLDFDSSLGASVATGETDLLSEAQRWGAAGDVFVVQDVWALPSDRQGQGVASKLLRDGTVYYWMPYGELTLPKLQAMLSEVTSFTRVCFLLDQGAADVFLGSEHAALAPGSVKLLAVSAFDQEGYVFWKR